MDIKKFTPSVDKSILILLPGIMWCGVGIMLVSLATSWLRVLPATERIIYTSVGLLAAMPIHHFGFLRIVDKNLRRLLPLTEKKCVFSFMTWKSYLLVLVMVSMGLTLRHSAMPKKYLSLIYNGIGLALFLSGIRYFRYFFKLVTGRTTTK
jgi:uncharacterized membrane protein YuzA (DUF378 family)